MTNDNLVSLIRPTSTKWLRWLQYVNQLILDTGERSCLIQGKDYRYSKLKNTKIITAITCKERLAKACKCGLQKIGCIVLHLPRQNAVGSRSPCALQGVASYPSHCPLWPVPTWRMQKCIMKWQNPSSFARHSTRGRPRFTPVCLSCKHADILGVCPGLKQTSHWYPPCCNHAWAKAEPRQTSYCFVCGVGYRS